MRTPWPHQREAIDKLSNGSVLVGSMGSGKSFVGLMYFFESVLGGSTDPLKTPSKRVDIYVITTAMKRDRFDWQKEAARFGISTNSDKSLNGIKLVVDSWNNINKYSDVQNAFFIFDEQKTIGYGVWSKTFIKIAKNNGWILLTATPGDKWISLMPLFIANGFYKNKTDFVRQHVVYSPYVKFPKIKMYLGVRKLKYFKDKIFVVMPFKRDVEVHIKNVKVDFDKHAILEINKMEWNPFTDKPIKTLAEHIYVARRILNSHESRINSLIDIHHRAKKLIVFYNYDYELEILRSGFSYTTVKEHNGHKHDPLPNGDNWVYLVQYLSGNEAWECFTTNHMAFYSMNYSYSITIQAMGRINRMTSPFEKLFYYRLISDSIIDRAVNKAYEEKRDFNEEELGINFQPRE